MHCAWLPLLKHFTNGINVPSALVVGPCQPSVEGERGDGERGEVRPQLNLSRWHLFYFLPGHLEFTQTDDFIIKRWPTSQLWHSPHTCTHTWSMQQQSEGERVTVRRSRGLRAVLLRVSILACGVLRIHTNVFISGPVKMSSLCLFSPHSEWHNVGLKNAIINLNVPWRFPTPPSTCVKT